jgi:hypothetical protein
MTTVRFLMRRFRDKSAQTKLRPDVAPPVPIKVQPLLVPKPKSQELQIKWGNPVRWHI